MGGPDQSVLIPWRAHTKILVHLGKAVCQPHGAAWKREVGPVRDTLPLTPGFHQTAKSQFEKGRGGRKGTELKKNVVKTKQGGKGVSV